MESRRDIFVTRIPKSLARWQKKLTLYLAHLSGKKQSISFALLYLQMHDAGYTQLARKSWSKRYPRFFNSLPASISLWPWNCRARAALFFSLIPRRTDEKAYWSDRPALIYIYIYISIHMHAYIYTFAFHRCGRLFCSLFFHRRAAAALSGFKFTFCPIYLDWTLKGRELRARLIDCVMNIK